MTGGCWAVDSSPVSPTHSWFFSVMVMKLGCKTHVGNSNRPPCLPSRGRQVSHQRWISGTYITYASAKCEKVLWHENEMKILFLCVLSICVLCELNYKIPQAHEAKVKNGEVLCDQRPFINTFPCRKLSTFQPFSSISVNSDYTV